MHFGHFRLLQRLRRRGFGVKDFLAEFARTAFFLFSLRNGLGLLKKDGAAGSGGRILWGFMGETLEKCPFGTCFGHNGHKIHVHTHARAYAACIYA